MLDDYEKDPKYKAIFKKNGKKIKERVNLLVEEFGDYIDGINIPKDSVHLPVELAFDVVRNYFIDLSRVKEFHNIEHAKGIKIAAYQTSWLLRIKPVQIIHIDPQNVQRYVLLNEHFAFHTMVSQLYNRSTLNNNDLTAWNKFIDHLIYHFHFRNTNPQSIELMLEAIDVQATWNKKEN